jgi:hypothetical protein
MSANTTGKGHASSSVSRKTAPIPKHLELSIQWVDTLKNLLPRNEYRRWFSEDLRKNLKRVTRPKDYEKLEQALFGCLACKKPARDEKYRSADPEAMVLLEPHNYCTRHREQEDPATKHIFLVASRQLHRLDGTSLQHFN